MSLETVLEELIRGDWSSTDPMLSRFVDFAKAIPSVGADLETVILKCHLIVEDSIRTLIDEKTKDPESIRKARLTFHQAVYVSKALLTNKGESWLWDGALKLNSIRNQMAHNLEVTGIDDRLSDLIEFCFANHASCGHINEKDLPEAEQTEKVKMSTFLLLASFVKLSQTPSNIHQIR